MTLQNFEGTKIETNFNMIFSSGFLRLNSWNYGKLSNFGHKPLDFSRFNTKPGDLGLCVLRCGLCKVSPVSESLDPPKPVFRIQIRIRLASWILIRIRNAGLDPGV
jgi:hypothetical protein